MDIPAATVGGDAARQTEQDSRFGEFLAVDGGADGVDEEVEKRGLRGDKGECLEVARREAIEGRCSVYSVLDGKWRVRIHASC